VGQIVLIEMFAQSFMLPEKTYMMSESKICTRKQRQSSDSLEFFTIINSKEEKSYRADLEKYIYSSLKCRFSLSFEIDALA
jgi:hypothetical protein